MPFRERSRATGSRACPACPGTLQERRLAGIPVHECVTCLGVWLAPRVFNDLWMDLAAQRRLLAALPAQDRGLPPSHPCSCATCGRSMARRELGGASGIIVDTCKRHGIWFDRGELSHALRYLLEPPEIEAEPELEDPAIAARRRRELIDTILDREERPPRWARWLGAIFEALGRSMK